jgi:isopentenyl-diphosphate delta-isomerase
LSAETPQLFESRKADHIRLALEDRMQTTGLSGLDKITLLHEAFPELDFNEITIEQQLFSGASASSARVQPLFVSSMTAGHAGSVDLNLSMARVCEKRNWAMGVGSQRRQLTDKSADLEWSKIRKACPRVHFFGNIGLAQLIKTGVDDIRRLSDTLEADAIFVHTNPLQECMQPEGTPQFAGGYRALEKLVKELGLPVIVKETGCGFSPKTLARLNGMGLAAVDVSGIGGTHWGRLEGGRSQPGTTLQKAAETFGDWGIGTVDSVLNAVAVQPDYEIWASGGVRTGLDAAKLIALGAKMVGYAKPIIEAALKGEEELDSAMAQLELELKIALFCTGSKSPAEIQEKKPWQQRS